MSGLNCSKISNRNKKDEKWYFGSKCKDSILHLVTLLNQNKILITSTDTIPGFLAQLSQENFERLQKLKGGRGAKPFIILVANAKQLRFFVDCRTLTGGMRRIIAQYWPGPLTIIFKAKKGLKPFLKSSEGTIAIRCPDHEGLQCLLGNVKGLFSTSANRSSLPAPQTIAQVDQELVHEVDGVVCDRSTRAKAKGKPSTIIRFGVKGIELIREGAISFKDLERTYETRDDND